ncbi:hypothetical protein [Actinoplanes sp. L3-i22]|uniref:hypothetical protein n=1 Tax=Actinoplanes sp. L3-i22 TaxID=2836373 RepID=UPI001C7445D1|nr:hypothetical protein [Actinoplanes sp. L3-i22]BCY15493.1 hypothetical protein L3i22_105810 [Actinoplanes sp. L3-i22]
MSDLKTSLHEWAARTDAGQAPVGDLIAAGTKLRNRRRAGAVGTSALALAAVAGVAFSLSGTTAPATPTAAGDPGTAATPAMELAAAATSTAGSSFKFAVKSTLTLAEWKIDHVTSVCSGALDPGKETGFVEGGVFGTRVVDGHYYVRKSTLWVDRGKGTLAEAMLCSDAKAPAGLAADPTAELKTLAKQTKVTKTATGYTFVGDEVHGTVKVSGGKVTELSYSIDHKKSADYPAYTRETTLKLSGYGEKVSVKKPL